MPPPRKATEDRERPIIGLPILPDRIGRCTVLMGMRETYRKCKAEAAAIADYPAHAAAWLELAAALEPFGKAVAAILERQESEPAIVAERAAYAAAWGQNVASRGVDPAPKTDAAACA
jgi:hypothetical protein